MSENPYQAPQAPLAPRKRPRLPLRALAAWQLTLEPEKELTFGERLVLKSAVVAFFAIGLAVTATFVLRDPLDVMQPGENLYLVLQFGAIPPALLFAASVKIWHRRLLRPL